MILLDAAMRSKLLETYKNFNTPRLGLEACTCNSSTQEAEAGGLLQVQGQPDLNSKFQVRQNYMTGPFLKNKRENKITLPRQHPLMYINHPVDLGILSSLALGNGIFVACYCYQLIWYCGFSLLQDWVKAFSAVMLKTLC